MTRPFRPAVAGLWECVGVLASLFAATHSAESVRGRIALQKHCVPNPNLACQNVTFASNNFTLFAVAEKAVQDFWLAARRSRD